MKVIKVDTRMPLDQLVDLVKGVDNASLVFDGWNNDRRELVEIPKVRKYLKSFINTYPEIYSYLDERSQYMLKLAWCEAKPVNKDFVTGHVDWGIDKQALNRFEQLIQSETVK